MGLVAASNTVTVSSQGFVPAASIDSNRTLMGSSETRHVDLLGDQGHEKRDDHAAAHDDGQRSQGRLPAATEKVERACDAYCVAPQRLDEGRNIRYADADAENRGHSQPPWPHDLRLFEEGDG